MATVGIIAEFNPLHLGHKYIIDCAKSGGNTVICAISGNFVQRGDTAILPKQMRTKCALLCGADIVVELPVLWSMSTAQNFALGGVWQLYNMGCDKILFGSESGDITALKAAADILFGYEFSVLAAQKVRDGITFAAAREQAAMQLGVDFKLLRNPNDNLGIEYIIAAKRLNLPIEFDCVKRQGAAHDSDDITGGYVSASFIRERMVSGNIGYCERFMPRQIKGIINDDCISDIKRIENAILCTLRMKKPEDLKNLPDISEGIENKLYFSAQVATSLDELCNMIKTKRYTMARVRRLVLSAFLGLDNEFFMKTPPYVRILGFSKSGEAHLNPPTSLIPVITRATQIKQLECDAQKVFETECKATDVYSLSLKKPLECGAEFKIKLLKTEELS